MFSQSRSTEDIIILLLFIVLLISTLGYFLRQGFGEKGLHFQISTQPESLESLPRKVVSPKQEIVVHLSGSVLRPGVYYLEEGDRVVDLIKKGGGKTPQGDLDLLNLAAPLYDGQKIHVPSKNSSSLPIAVSRAESSSGLININTASKKQLEELTGVGPSRAQAIIDYREREGFFSTKEELMNVPGIGEKTFRDLADSISLY